MAENNKDGVGDIHVLLQLAKHSRVPEVHGHIRLTLAEKPALWALRARWWLCIACASCSAREMLYCCAHLSAQVPMCTSL